MYTLHNAAGETIPTSYFTEVQDSGQITIWFGASLQDPNRKLIGQATSLEQANWVIKRMLILDGCGESDDSPEGKNCGNCGRELNENIAVDVEGRGWYCHNCAKRYANA